MVTLQSRKVSLFNVRELFLFSYGMLMKRGIYKFLFLFFFIVNGFKVCAQVLPQDSLALIAFYNSTDGPNWTDHTNWLSGNVVSWAGVGVVGNRVQTLALNGNNLTGSIPDEFCDLTALEYIYLRSNHLSGNLPTCIGNAVSINSIDLSNNNMSGTFPAAFATTMPDLADIWISNNHFTGFPDLTSVIELSNLHVDGNELTFEHIVPNTSILNLGYVYSPQNTIMQNGPDVLINIFDPFTLSVVIGGTGNTYQWQANFLDVVDNARFTGATTSTLSNNSALVADGGFYSCIVKNAAAPLLTLQVQSSRVEVTDNRLPQTLNYPTDTSMYCGMDVLQFPPSTGQGLPLSYHNDIDNFAVINSVLVVNAVSPGTAAFRVYNSGNVTYLPFEDTIRVVVSTHYPIPDFAIANDLPIYQGEELNLTVQEVPGVTYAWTTPDLGNDEVSSIYRPAGSVVEGIYKVSISEGSCLYDTLQLAVTFAVDDNIVIYELITPNGDGANETFFIKNIEALPPTDVTVFNVWHQVVYNKKNYGNDWDGGGLPVGTYYYLVEVEDWDKIYKGNLYIKR